MSHLDLTIKMDTADIKVLKSLCELSLQCTSKIANYLVFVRRPDESLEVQCTDSFIVHRVTFGKVDKPVMLIDDKRVEDMQPLLQKEFVAVVRAEQLLLVTRNILKHKKSTVDSTCYLKYTTRSSIDINNVVDDGAIRNVEGIWELDSFVGEYKHQTL